MCSSDLERLPLRPSEASALLPLYEAVSNSLHAIQDRFGDEKLAQNGRIDIQLIREPGDSIRPAKTLDQARLRDADLRLHFFARLCTA